MHTVAALTEFFYSRDVTPRTREWYEKHLTTFLDWCASEGINDVADITLPLVRRYMARLAETTSRFGKPLSSQTRHGYARAIR